MRSLCISVFAWRTISPANLVVIPTQRDVCPLSSRYPSRRWKYVSIRTHCLTLLQSGSTPSSVEKRNSIRPDIFLVLLPSSARTLTFVAVLPLATASASSSLAHVLSVLPLVVQHVHVPSVYSCPTSLFLVAFVRIVKVRHGLDRALAVAMDRAVSLPPSPSSSAS